MVPFHFILPMAGAGSRFKAMGYNQPKPLIPLHGKPAFYWAAQSVLQGSNALSITAIVLQQHITEWNIDKQLQHFFPTINIVVLPQVLNGAALTCLQGTQHMPTSNHPIAFIDCDLAFRSTALDTLQNTPAKLKQFESCSGMLMSFPSNNPAYSYLQEDSNGFVTCTKEKQVISPHAISGCYWFKNVQTFQTHAQNYLQNCPYNEFFMSGIYNKMLVAGEKVMHLPINFHLSFGTPAEYQAAESKPEWSQLGVALPTAA